MKVITVANQKGGVGKTSTALTLLAGLRQRGYKTLGIDLDSQCNLSLSVMASQNKGTVADLVIGAKKAKEVIQETKQGAFISSSDSLDQMETLIKSPKSLAVALEPIKKDYDFIIIDTPPRLNILTLTAFTACNYVVITTDESLYALQGLDGLLGTIKAVETVNKDIKIAGVLITKYNGRTNTHKEATASTESLADRADAKLFKTKIRNSVKVSSAPYNLQSVIEYAPKSEVAKDYQAFIDELLERIN